MKRRRRKSVVPPSPREFDALVQETWVLVSLLSGAYSKAHEEQGWPRGGQGVYVSGGDYSDTTAEAVFDPLNRQRRADCLQAVEWLRKALEAAEKALGVLQGERVEQPQKVDARAKITQAEFEWKIHKGRHAARVPTCLYCREEQLRGAR